MNNGPLQFMTGTRSANVGINNTPVRGGGVRGDGRRKRPFVSPLCSRFTDVPVEFNCNRDNFSGILRTNRKYNNNDRTLDCRTRTVKILVFANSARRPILSLLSLRRSARTDPTRFHPRGGEVTLPPHPDLCRQSTSSLRGGPVHLTGPT